MKISDFIQQGRQLYGQCLSCKRHEPIDLTTLPPDMDHSELYGRLKCSKCGRTALPLPQANRQMRRREKGELAEIALLDVAARGIFRGLLKHSAPQARH